MKQKDIIWPLITIEFWNLTKYWFLKEAWIYIKAISRIFQRFFCQKRDFSDVFFWKVFSWISCQAYFLYWQNGFLEFLFSDLSNFLIFVPQLSPQNVIFIFQFFNFISSFVFILLLELFKLIFLYLRTWITCSPAERTNVVDSSISSETQSIEIGSFINDLY